MAFHQYCSIFLLRWLVPTCFFVLALVSHVSASRIITEEMIRFYGEEMTSWLVHSKGGFMSDALEIRRRVPKDPTSPVGIFATEMIPSGEVIFRIPREAYLSVPLQDMESSNSYIVTADGKVDNDFENKDETDLDWTLSFRMEMQEHYNKTCILSQQLLKETQRYRESPETSMYAPYIRYLEDTQSMGQIPATYSQRGKDLLRRIQGIEEADLEHPTGADFVSNKVHGLSPLLPEDLVDWIDTHFVQTKCFEADDLEAYHAVALVIQRGFDLELIPVWDMHNHDVQERLNVKTNSIRSYEGLVVTTTKTIRAGDEILYTYNYCTDCFDEGDIWGTPGMYREFGFVEGYPQYWPFHDQGVYVTVESTHDGTLHARFEDKSAPDAESLTFFKIHLTRLESMDIEAEVKSLTSSLEIDMIGLFYESLKDAVAAILQTESSDYSTKDSSEGDDDNDENLHEDDDDDLNEW